VGYYNKKKDAQCGSGEAEIENYWHQCVFDNILIHFHKIVSRNACVSAR